jgi:hypothetical protein
MKTFLCLAALLCSALVVTPQDAPKKKVVYLSFMDGFKDARKAGLQSMMVARDLSEEDLAKEYENAKKNKMGFAVVRPGDEAYDEFTPGVTKITVTPKLKAGVKEDPSLSFYVDYDQAAGECIKQDKNLALWVGITPKEAPSFRRAMDGALHCYLESMEGCPDRSVVVKGNDDYSYIISQEKLTVAAADKIKTRLWGQPASLTSAPPFSAQYSPIQSGGYYRGDDGGGDCGQPTAAPMPVRAAPRFPLLRSLFGGGCGG